MSEGNDRDMHQLLGALKRDMESSISQRADLFVLVRDVGIQVATLVSELKAHMDKEDSLEASHSKLTDRVTKIERDQSKIAGAFALIAASMGGTWGKITGWF